MTTRTEQGIRDSFLEEVESYLPKIRQSLEQFAADPGQRAGIEEAFRLTHCIRGAGATLGLTALSQVAQWQEEALEGVLAGQIDFDSASCLALLDSVSHIEEVVAATKAGLVPPEWDSAGTPDLGRLSAGVDSEEPEDDVPEEVPQELMDSFLQEAEEHLQGIGERLRELSAPDSGPEALQVLRRSVHTLKGSAGVVGLRATSRLAHRLEDFLDALHEGALTASEDHLRLLQASFDLISDIVAGQGVESRFQTRLAEAFGGWNAISGSQAPTLPESRTSSSGRSQPAGGGGGRKAGSSVRIPLERLDEVMRSVSELVIQRASFERYLDAYTRELDELRLSVERLTRLSRKLQADCETGRPGGSDLPYSVSLAGQLGGHWTDFDALELDRYTELELLSKDLSETAADVAAGRTRLREMVGDFDNHLRQLGNLTGEVEERVTRLRMLPLATLTTRLQRTVRVTAERQGKLVDLVVEGEAVEFDKNVLETLSGPFDHILRNAVDHGIEIPAARASAGKSERGVIRVSASQQGSETTLRIADDGGGLDPEAIRSAAVSRGYLSQADAAGLSEQDLYPLIFQPGFSTARELSEISGRGIGLDDVKAAVERMKGTISVDSRRGQGVVLTIRLPITVAITRVLLVQASGQTYAVPLSAVEQILRAEPDQVEKVGQSRVLRMADRLLPLVLLAELLDLEREEMVERRRLPVVALNVGGRRVAMAVDELLEAREVVVKPLGSLLGTPKGLSGAALLGDGSVVLIVNPSELLRPAAAAVSGAGAASRHAEPAAQGPLDVLIVDDSPTVRRVLTNLVNGAGWRPQTARDGLEALEVLQRASRKPDVVLLDVEMPRMDGYEFAAALRGQPSYRTVPIVMLTSRAGEKHRRKAFEQGVDEYLVKPYQDEHLLAVVRSLAGRGPRTTRR